MLFVEPRFFLFLALVAGLYWSLPGNRSRKVVLLAASYVFYAAWDYRFLSLILISTVVDYTAALAMSRSAKESARRLWLLLSLVVNLGMLGFFKYFNFFAESASDLMAAFGVELSQTTLDITLPVGISFYTFQTLSYTIDVYRGKLKPRTQLLDVALFVAFFPQLVAGPIVRAATFLPQLDSVRSFARVHGRACLALFLSGFVKKAVVADNVAPFVDEVFSNPGLYDSAALVVGACLYAVQIYCDFSGYSDMAIAVAGLLGFALPVNFRTPYLAASITDFWRRWHISLSSWLRDYLYIPLGGNRGSRLATQRNLMLTMLLGGLWHGAAWNFVVWGFLHGLALSLEREWRRSPWAGALTGGLALAGGTALTLGWVLVAWVFFRAPDFATATEYLGRIVTLADGQALAQPAWLWAVFPVFLGLQFVQERWDLLRRASTLPMPVFSSAYGAAMALAVAFVPTGYRPFIYFQF
ncbi:MAG: MBOAT family O-acyltransferase [Pseudomonadota bacterium]